MAEAPTGTVTLLFTDIEGSTRLLQRVGDAYAGLLSDHRRLLAEAFERHGGNVVDSEGDAFFVAFASARDAVGAAEAAQRALAAHEWPAGEELRVRMGLHTGEPQLVDARYVGLDVHHAARVMAAGHGGQVLVSESTRALLDDAVRLRDLGEHRLKDLTRPQRLYQLELEGLPSEFPPLKTLDNRPTNLPIQPNELIGRERELREAQELLLRDDLRLLTLTGTGGAGKTRLALQLAADVVDEFADGVFFVSLAPVRDWELVLPAIARTLGLREQPGETFADTLTEYARDKRMLLVLDNFEQVLAAAPALAGLSSTAPGLRVVATSRTPLRLSGERTYAVPPLELPESVRLFADRAHAAGIDVEDGEAVAEICRRLDGLPLAIELAAPRVRTLPPQALLRRLDQRLKLLTGGPQDLDERQRTLRGTIEWSYELLPAAERTLFARLAIFVGGCRLDAADALCDADGSLGLDVLDGLGSLVEKSLLRQRPDADGEPRFWMLETIREYALELLAARGELDAARRRHAEWYLGLAEQAGADARTGDQAAVFDLLEAEYANVRAAIDWARECAERGLLLRLATALWDFWATRGHIAEGRGVLEEALAGTDERPARALLGLCALRILGGRSEGVVEDVDEALRACEELGDDFSLAQAWNLKGRVDGSLRGRIAEGERAWREALRFAERGEFAAEKAEAVSWLLVAAIFGPLPVQDGIARCREFYEAADGEPVTQAFCCCEQAVLEAMRGDFGIARELLASGRQALEELGQPLWVAVTGQEAFFVEMLAGEPAAAATALRQSDEALREMGERSFRSTIAGLLAHALCALGEDDEADGFSRACESAAGDDDVLSQVLWRSARAKVLARRGELEAAEAAAREAVAIADRTDLLTTEADALLDLAEVLGLAGRTDEARAAARDAAERFERKGSLPSLARARELAAP